MTAWKKLGITNVKDGRKTFEAGGRLLKEKDYGWGTVVVDTGAIGGSTHLYQQAADALLKTQAKYPTGLLEGQTAEAELKALPGMLEEKKKKDALAMEAYRQELGLAGGLTGQALEDDYQKAKATLRRPFNPNAPGKRLKASGNASTFNAAPAAVQAPAGATMYDTPAGPGTLSTHLQQLMKPPEVIPQPSNIVDEITNLEATEDNIITMRDPISGVFEVYKLSPDGKRVKLTEAEKKQHDYNRDSLFPKI